MGLLSFLLLVLSSSLAFLLLPVNNLLMFVHILLQLSLLHVGQLVEVNVHTAILELDGIVDLEVVVELINNRSREFSDLPDHISLLRSQELGNFKATVFLIELLSFL